MVSTAGLPPSRRTVVLALGATQTLAWGSSFYLPAILAAPMGSATGVSISTVFALFSVALLISGLLGPSVGRRIDRLGGRGVLVASNVVLAAGLAALAAATDMVTLGLAFALLGVGMGIGLYDSAFAALGRLYGYDARSAITGISLMAGFASTIAWPLTSLGLETIGWRGTCLSWAAAHVLIGLPLNWFLLPVAAPLEPQTGEAKPPPAISFDRNMWLLTFAFAAIWFVAGAMAAHMPAILVASGASQSAAILAASLMGPAQVAARVFEARVLMRYHPLLSARLACLGHPLAAAVLLTAGPVAAPLFGILHGLGNGILTIARGTVPLAIYGPANYGYRLGLLGAPARVAQASAPYVVSVALDRGGGNMALILTAAAGVLTGLAFLVIRQQTEHNDEPPLEQTGERT